MRNINRFTSFLKFITIATGLFSLSPSIFAFGSDEHRQMSNLALGIAIDFTCKNASIEPANIPLNCSKIMAEENSLLDENNRHSYGKINELVDHTQYPEQVFERFRSVDNYPLDDIPRDHTHLSSHVLSLRESVEHTPTRTAILDYLSASSHNERHFQDALMESMRYLHETAVDDAEKGNLYKALVQNALSDHYLNDFFAPGHISTPRENSHDTVALAMHDRANRAGACFDIEDDYWHELEPILEFMKTTTRRVPKNRIGNVSIDEEDDIERIRENLAECSATVVDLSDDELLLFRNEEGEGAYTFQVTLIDQLIRSNDQLYLQGDGRLRLNPTQLLFMLAVQIRSISEVLQTFLGCEKETFSHCDNDGFSNLTTNYQWQGTYDFNTKKLLIPEAGIRYGRYSITRDETEKVNTLLGRLQRPKYAYPAIADNAFLLSIGGQSPTSHESSRVEAQLELFPMKIGTTNKFEGLRDNTIQRPSTECDVFELCNLGFAYGITAVHDNNFRATNLQLRVIKAFPKIAGQISVVLRTGHYRGRNEHRSKFNYGIRYESGFSLLTFYIGLHRDYGFSSDDIFGAENVVSFGATVSLPSSRILGFIGGYE